MKALTETAPMSKEGSCTTLFYRKSVKEFVSIINLLQKVIKWKQQLLTSLRDFINFFFTEAAEKAVGS